MNARARSSALLPRGSPHRRAGIVLKPFIDGRTYQQLFRLETCETHDLLDGPFEHIKRAMESGN